MWYVTVAFRILARFSPTIITGIPFIIMVAERCTWRLLLEEATVAQRNQTTVKTRIKRLAKEKSCLIQQRKLPTFCCGNVVSLFSP
jgi:hypothetical protein